MIDQQKIEELTMAYIHSYNVALRETRNPNMAVQVATSIVMTIGAMPKKQQAVNPLEILMMATAMQKGEKKEDDDNKGGADHGKG
jgi:hypothetical protein